MSTNRRDELRARLEKGPPLICDGGMGAELLKRGWQGPTEDANLAAPQTVEEIHRAFRQAGAEILLTNTFTVPFRAERDVVGLVGAGVARARAVADGAFVVGSIGPAVDAELRSIRAIAAAFDTAEVDALIIETLPADSFDPSRILLRNVESAFAGPVFISFRAAPAFDMASFRNTIWEMRTPVIGLNCGAGPSAVLGRLGELVDAARGKSAWQVPTSLRPSAGLPTGEGRSLQYPVTPEEFADFGRAAAKLGARIIGGCCGASPAHIAALAKTVREVEEVRGT